MGVTGLWRLIEPAGKPVPVETLENKVLAVDISIWLHQMVKGYQDAKGAPLPNAHLMGLFQRLCKLLYFRIKPIFVFDGGFPDLKKETIAKRQDSKAKYHSESERLKRELALILGKRTAVNSLLGKQVSPKKNPVDARNDDDLFKLPALPDKEESESDSEDDQDSSSGSIVDVHSLDIESDNFKTLPAKEKYELLVELKETRKMNSWGKLHQLPKKSDNFSDFQMQRLLKRRKVQECLQETEKEMGDVGMSLNDLESLLNEEGIDTKIESLPSRRIASNNTTRFLLISDVKQALAEAKKKKEAEENPVPIEREVTAGENPQEKSELDEDLEKAIKMSLECVDNAVQKPEDQKSANEANSSACMSKTDDSWTSLGSDTENTDSEECDGFDEPETMASAKAYIMQYTDFTHKAIDKMIVRKNKKTVSKNKVLNVDKIIEELNNEKSVIVDNINLSSSDDESQDLNADLRKDVHPSNDLESSNVDATQESVVCIGNPVEEIISLDTTIEEESIHADNEKPCSSTMEPLHKSYDQNQLQVDSDFSDEEFEEVPEIESIEEIISQETPVGEESIHADHEKPCSSTMNPLQKPYDQNQLQADSDSSDEEFEEVPEIESIQSVKPVVELTLNVGEAPEDDIFADIFNKKSELDIIRDTNAEISRIVQEMNAIENISRDCVTVDKMNKNNDNHTNPKAPTSDIEIKSKTDQENGAFTSKNSNRVTVKEATNTEEIKDKETNKDDLLVEKKGSEQDVLLIKEKGSEKMKIPSEPISVEALNNMAEELQNEERDLLQEKGRLDRVGRNITEQMTKEAQELLQIFGIPYIIAPMEAEAQCAFLESVKLTDGTITDDSDIWLFGGKTVYKNFFNQKKHVLQFLSERIERSFNLTREQLILLALLVGSDYTTGVAGVGPVTALEILASFPFNKKQFLNEATKQARYAKIIAGLQEFKQWVRAGKRTDNTTLKNKLKNVELGEDFPSVRVVQAYMEPNVEKSEEKFTWGELDVAVLRDYTRAKFGWSQNKLDEIINPVLKRLQDRKSQKTVHDYFKRKIEFQYLEEQMSKRVKAAVHKMGPETDEPALSIAEEPKPKAARKRKIYKNSEAEKSTATEPSKQPKTNEDAVLNDHKVKVVSQITDGKSSIEITIPKTDRFQEIIPQREKDKQSLLENKMKAIELFRKNKIDRKKKTTKKRPNLPKPEAELSESDSD